MTDWQPTLEVDGRLMNLHDVVKHLISKGKVLHYEKKGDDTFTAILKSPKDTPTTDQIVESILWAVRKADNQNK